MAAPTDSGEWDMVSEDFYSDLSSLLSPAISPPQNQEHEDIGFEESNMGFERIRGDDTCFNFSPSSSPRPLPSVFLVSGNTQDIDLVSSCQHILEDKSGALHVINGDKEQYDIIDLLFHDFFSYVANKFIFWDEIADKFGALNQIASAPGVVPKGIDSLVDNILEQEEYDEREVTLRRINWLKQPDKNMICRPGFEVVGVVDQQIQDRGGELDVILGEGVLMINGLKCRDCQGSPRTPETLRICQANVSCRVWLGNDDQLAAEICYKWNRLNIGNFTTVEDAISTYEMSIRWSGRMDLTGFPGLSIYANRSKLPLQLPPAAQ